MWKRRILILMGLMLLLSLPALALEDSGSLSLTLETQSGPVSGGSITLYRVGDLVERDGDYSFSYSGSFSDCEYPLDGDLMNEDLAQNIWDYVVENAIPPVGTYPVDESGKVRIQSLPVGLYLLCQTQEQAKEGYYAMKPFLISLPLWDDVERQWIYQVDASPKAQVESAPTSTPSPSPSPTPTPTPTPPSGTPRPSSPPSTPGPDLPDTGQTNWPVPVLAVSGLIIFMLGWAIRFTGRKSGNEK